MRLHQAAWNSSCVRFCGCTIAQSIGCPVPVGYACDAVQWERIRKDLSAETSEPSLERHSRTTPPTASAGPVPRWCNKRKGFRWTACLFVCLFACLLVCVLICSRRDGWLAPTSRWHHSRSSADAESETLARDFAVLTPCGAPTSRARCPGCECCEHGTCLCTLSTSKHHERSNGGRK